MPRKVIVTGGSRGLGLGIVRRLICEGYDAIAIARQTNDQLSSAIEHADRTRPGSLRFIPFDLGEMSAIPELVTRIRRDARSDSRARQQRRPRDGLLFSR